LHPKTDQLHKSRSDDIEKYLLDEGKLKVSSAEIGDLVKNRLKELDPVSYLRFVSVFDGFEDIKDFEEFIKSFEKKNLDTKG